MSNLNFTFTITSTDRCNAACTYCHYYSKGGKAAQRNGGTSRNLFRSDISDSTLEAYFKFMNCEFANLLQPKGVAYSTDPARPDTKAT